GRLGDGLDGADGQAEAAALLTEEAEVFLSVGRDLVQHGDPLVVLPLEPRRHERRVAAAVPVAQLEAVFPGIALRAAPADDRHLRFVRVRRDGDRVIRAVGSGDHEAALLDQPAVAVDRVLGGAVGQAVLGADHVLDRPREHTGLAGLLEGHAVDLVVAAPLTVQTGAQPSHLDRLELAPRACCHQRLRITLDGRRRGSVSSGDVPIPGRFASYAAAWSRTPRARSDLRWA